MAAVGANEEPGLHLATLMPLLRPETVLDSLWRTMPCKPACPPEWKPFGQPVLRSCLGLWGQWDVGKTGPAGRIWAGVAKCGSGGALGAKSGQKRIKAARCGWVSWHPILSNPIKINGLQGENPAKSGRSG
jgi:hypothetical protein